MVSISYMDYFLPGKKINVSEYFDLLKEENPGLLGNFEEVKKYFLNQAGFGDIYLGDREELLSHFEDLVRKYLEKNKDHQNQVKYIFYTDTQTAFTSDFKSIAMHVRNKFNFDEASVLIIDQQCASCIWTIGMASRLLKEGERALLLTANSMDNYTDRYKPHSIIGDGAVIVEFSNGAQGLEIVDFDFKSKQYIGEFGISNNLGMMKACAKNMLRFLERKNISKEEIACVIHQNLSKECYEIIFTTLMKIEEKQLFWENIKRIAHIGDADLIFNLMDMTRHRDIPENQYILLYAIGEVSHSANYNCVLLKANK